MHPPNIWSDITDFAHNVAGVAAAASTVASNVSEVAQGFEPTNAQPHIVASPVVNALAPADNSGLLIAGLVALLVL